LFPDAIDQHKSLCSTSGRGARGGFALGLGHVRAAEDAPPGATAIAPTSRNMKLVLTPQELANSATNRLLPATASSTPRRPVATSAGSPAGIPGLFRQVAGAGTHTLRRIVPAVNRAPQTPAASTPKRSTPCSSSSNSEYITKRQGKNLQLINKAVLPTVAATHAQNVKTSVEKKRKLAQVAAALKAQRRKARAEALARCNIVSVGGTRYMKSRSGRTIVVAKAGASGRWIHSRNVTINGVMFTMDSTGKKLVRGGPKSKNFVEICPAADEALSDRGQVATLLPKKVNISGDLYMRTKKGNLVRAPLLASKAFGVRKPTTPTSFTQGRPPRHKPFCQFYNRFGTTRVPFPHALTPRTLLPRSSRTVPAKMNEGRSRENPEISGFLWSLEAAEPPGRRACYRSDRPKNAATRFLSFVLPFWPPSRPVLLYKILGKCKKGYLCPFAHDPKHVVVCKRHLQGSCAQGTGCPFSHLLVPEKVPLCVHFARGSCSKSECRYLHSRVSPTADVCRAFALENYCPQGARCKLRHVFECPDYRPGEGVESCQRGKTCKLPHVDTMNRKAPAGMGKRGPVHLDGDRTAKRARPYMCDGVTADRAISLDSDEDESNARHEENDSLLFPDFDLVAAASLSEQELEDEGESEEKDVDHDACDERGSESEPEAEGEQEDDDDQEAQEADYDTDDLLSGEEEAYDNGDIAGDAPEQCSAEEALPLVPTEEKNDFGASYLAFE
ncbi:MAG: hypothetical protein BJ554DRAFT_7992, partial [Olpidium bornovanus]